MSILERLAAVEAHIEWLTREITRLAGAFTTVVVLGISGLAAVAFLVFKNKDRGE